ncbi:MAG: hypothetical protein H7Y11_07430 [Armatimonadetes bacterium]|nr:hypothetical protein [Anaerolineae bacterium]
MQFQQATRRVFAAVLLGLALVALSAAYWAVIGAQTLLLREDNARLFLAQASIVRGGIYDRAFTPLVISDEAATRRYLAPAMYSALGYYSLRYGVGGVEAVYDQTLRGDNLPRDLSAYFATEGLHRPQRGSDLQLTLDERLQTAAVNALGSYRGAVVLLDAESGAVLALVSAPSFDPNTLDTNWETLTAAPEEPFFNRALQGRYQPGSVLQTPLLAAALLAGISPDQPTENPTVPVSVNGLTLRCALPPDGETLTLAQAYANACPAPFASLFDQVGAISVEQMFSAFRIGTPIILPGFEDDADVPLATPDFAVFSIGDALGQGDLTVSPLAVAVMTAAVVNDGNAPQPYLLLATRSPGSAVWQASNSVYATVPIITQATSEALRTVMQASALRLGSNGAGQGAHIATAYAGERAHAWFTGFAPDRNGRTIAVALVLEDTEDAAAAAQVGAAVLAAIRVG